MLKVFCAVLKTAPFSVNFSSFTECDALQIIESTVLVEVYLNSSPLLLLDSIYPPIKGSVHHFMLKAFGK